LFRKLTTISGMLRVTSYDENSEYNVFLKFMNKSVDKT